MKTYDLIIIGSGAAGLRAGVYALESGYDTIILEKRKVAGGNTRISDGGIAAYGTDWQRRDGIEDSFDRMKADMLEAGLHRNNESLVDEVVKGSKEAFEWTRSIGVPYDGAVIQFGGHSVKRCYTPVPVSGSTLVKKAKAAYRDLGGDLHKGSKVEDFLFLEGRVKGVRFRSPEDTVHTVHARHGVIVASGGFGADQGFLNTIDKRYSTLDTTNVKGATAEMLKSAQSIGADTVDLSEVQIAPWTSPKEKGFGHAPKFGDYIALPKGILVNPDTCERFVDELADRKRVADAVLALRKPAIAIADEKAVRNTGIDISKALKNGSVTTHDSLHALAVDKHMDPEALKHTIKDFNKSFTTGKDERFGKPLDNGAPIDTPPFYAMEVWPKIHYTMGGLRIDDRARVLDKSHTPIEGLYAAGECTGGVHGASRLGSCAITDALVFGKRAAMSALGELQ